MNWLAELNCLTDQELDLLFSSEAPIFLYHPEQIIENLRRTKTVLGQFSSDFQLLYSIKTNPHPEILSVLKDQVFGFDISSLAEMRLALKQIADLKSCSISGPAKTDEFILSAIENKIGVIHCDSEEEFDFILSRDLHHQTQLSLRISSQKPRQEKLGINNIQSLLKKTEARGLQLQGLHTYLGRENFSQSLMESELSRLVDFFETYPNHFVKKPQLFIGPGLPGKIQPEMFNLGNKKTFPYTIHFEAGRALMASAGAYAAMVLSVKRSDSGRKVAIINGGLQHLGSPFVSPGSGLSQIECIVIRDKAPLLKTTSEWEDTIVFGSLCLSLDSLHPSLRLPQDLRAGDKIVFPDCGAYGLTAGLVNFIGQDLPAEYLVQGSKQNLSLKEITNKNFKLYHQCFEFSDSFIL